MARQRIKFGADFSQNPVGQEAPGFYSGPPAPKGVYRFKLKRLEVGKSSPTSQNPGSPLLRYMVEMIGPAKLQGVKNKFLGMGVWGNLNVTEQGAPYVNNFLNALTDGSETGKARLQKAFWGKGVTISDDRKSVHQVGNLVIDSPNGTIELTASTKVGKDKDGNPRTEIARFLTPVSDEADDLTDQEADEDEDEDVEDDAPLEDDEDEADTDEDETEDDIEDSADEGDEDSDAEDEDWEEESDEDEDEDDAEPSAGDDEESSEDAEDLEDADSGDGAGDAGDGGSDEEDGYVDEGADDGDLADDDDEHDDQPVAQVQRSKVAKKAAPKKATAKTGAPF